MPRQKLSEFAYGKWPVLKIRDAISAEFGPVGAGSARYRGASVGGGLTISSTAFGSPAAGPCHTLPPKVVM